MCRKNRKVHECVRKTVGKQASRVHTIKDKHGKVLTDQLQVNERWIEHFQELYNTAITPGPTVLKELPVGGRNAKSTPDPDETGS